MMTYIYYLHHGDNIPFYIGKSNSPKERVYQHRQKFGKDVAIEIIDEVSLKEWRFWEQWYADMFKTWGYNLQNKVVCGGGPTHKISQFSNQDIKHIIKLYIKNEYSTNQIAEIYNVNGEVIRRMLKNHNIKRYARMCIHEEEHKIICWMYTELYLNSIQIAEKFGVVNDTILKILKRNNINVNRRPCFHPTKAKELSKAYQQGKYTVKQIQLIWGGSLNQIYKTLKTYNNV